MISYFLGNICAKNYHNRIMYVKIIASRTWDVFRHDVHGNALEPCTLSAGFEYNRQQNNIHSQRSIIIHEVYCDEFHCTTTENSDKLRRIDSKKTMIGFLDKPIIGFEMYSNTGCRHANISLCRPFAMSCPRYVFRSFVRPSVRLFRPEYTHALQAI